MSQAADLTRAVALLQQGELVGIPTETVYGLAADASKPAAVAKIFAAKGRPADHPLIVHVADAKQLPRWAREIPAAAYQLAEAFWPGPLTLILKRQPTVPDAVTGGQDTVGLRVPDHPLSLELLRRFSAAGGSGGVAAPSANRFGRISPTTAEHVRSEFGDELLVLDGGPCELGIESSIVDCSRGHPVLLRPGVLTRDRIEAAAGEALRDADVTAPRASGTLEAHYAPAAPLRVMSASKLHTALQLLGKAPLKLAVYSTSRPAGLAAGVSHRVMPTRADAAAHELFSVLREFDAERAQLIWVEEPPATPEWEGVRDRLRRAAAA